MISAILARSGGPPAAALSTSKASRKYSGPIAAGVITHSAFAYWLPLLSNRWTAPRGMHSTYEAFGGCPVDDLRVFVRQQRAPVPSSVAPPAISATPARKACADWLLFSLVALTLWPANFGPASHRSHVSSPTLISRKSSVAVIASQVTAKKQSRRRRERCSGPPQDWGCRQRRRYFLVRPSETWGAGGWDGRRAQRSAIAWSRSRVATAVRTFSIRCAPLGDQRICWFAGSAPSRRPTGPADGHHAASIVSTILPLCLPESINSCAWRA